MKGLYKNQNQLTDKENAEWVRKARILRCQVYIDIISSYADKLSQELKQI
jgi:hypothetical protein